MKKILTINMLFISILCSAQSGLSVDSVFNEYGRRQGSALLDLNKDVLGGHTRIERYKCLIIKANDIAANDIRKALATDRESRSKHTNAVTIKEITENGTLQNASYCLGNEAESSVTEYLLYSVSKGRITLVYLTGRFQPRELNGELSKLKDLFIKVNNKEIKLY